MLDSMYTNVSRNRNDLLYRGYNPSGHRIQKKIKFSPTLYVYTTKDPMWCTDKVSTKDSVWRGLHGEPVQPIHFKKMSDAKKFIDQYRNIPNFPVHGMTNYAHQYIAEKFPGDINYTSSQILIHWFDIEVESEEGFPDPEFADWPVISIAANNSNSKEYVVWGFGDYDPKDRFDKDIRVRYIKCKNEAELLRSYIGFFSRSDVDIVSGWNSEGFDIPYLVNRIRKILGEEYVKKLSPWGIVEQKEIASAYGKTIQSYNIVGISHIDYMAICKKFLPVLTKIIVDSYRLNDVAYAVLGEKKVSYEEYGDLNTLYKNDYTKFINYNIKDTQLLPRLEEKMKFLDILISLAYMGGVNFETAMGTTSLWDCIIYREMLKNKMVPPPQKENPKTKYEGAYVKEPTPGAYDWVVSFDLASLYPNTIIQYNMSPETLVEGVSEIRGVENYLQTPTRNTEYSVTPNGICFRKDKQGLLPHVIEGIYTKRKAIKKEQLNLEKELQVEYSKDKEYKISELNNKQMALKIAINSAYGAIGNAYFRYYDLRIAEGITYGGQLAVKWAEKAINTAISEVLKDDKDRVIAMDTDSCYIDMGDVVKKFNPKSPVDFLDKISQEYLYPRITKAYDDLATHMNAYQNRMDMDREVIASKGIWRKKKNYALYVHDSEGVRYEKPKMKIMGLEAVKSSTPEICRNRLKDLYEIFLAGTEKDAQELIQSLKEEFFEKKPHEVAIIKSVSNISKYELDGGFAKGTPINSRAAIVYNKAIREKGLEKAWPLLVEGDKIRYVYLKTPNPVKSNIVAMGDFLPEELGLSKYVDYETQFEKTFLSGVEPFFKFLNWRMEDNATLDDFFVW